MRPPEGARRRTWDAIMRLPPDVRDRVLERSCIFHYDGGVASLAEADEMALAAEGIAVQQSLGEPA